MKLRWRVASAVDKITGQCWADLVSWVLKSDGASRLPWRPQRSCQSDAAKNGACYCGKVRIEGTP